ncbi:MAG: FtsQ-type POTRA domain-containing protein [Bacteroides sp.]|nr:FtsQ-type POTRA domain-containing protein [Bacteroides sp.]
MPEFERKKRRSLSDQQLFDEYYENNKRSAAKKTSSSKKRSKGGKGKPSNTVKREAPPVSKERQRIKERYPEENAVWSENAYGGKKKKNAASGNGKAAAKRSAPRKKTSAGAQRKRKKHGSYVLYYFLCGIVAAVVVAVLSSTVLFNISVFEIVGETMYTDEEIVSACGISEGDNLLRIDVGSAEEKIVSELVYIDAVKIGRGFPNKLIITAEPARPAANFLVSGKYYLISEIGRLLEISDKPADCPIVKGYVLDPEKEAEPETKTVIGGKLAEDDEKRVAAANSIIGYMEQYGLDKESVIDLTDTLNIKITYDSRIEMELGTTAAMDEKIYNASLLVKNEITENEKCVLILTNPNRVPKRPIRDEAAGTEGYVVTETSETTAAQPEEGSSQE